MRGNNENEKKAETDDKSAAEKPKQESAETDDKSAAEKPKPAARNAVRSNDVREAAKKRAAGFKGGDSEANKMIAALETERAGYVKREDAGRVKQVDAQLARWRKQAKG